MAANTQQKTGGANAQGDSSSALHCPQCGCPQKERALTCKVCGHRLRAPSGTVMGQPKHPHHPKASRTGKPLAEPRASAGASQGGQDGARAGEKKQAGDNAHSGDVPGDLGVQPTAIVDSSAGVDQREKQLGGLVGKMVGEYEITHFLGEGGMGAVYAGVQPMIGKKVAVKVLKPALSEQQEVMDRFLAEARAVNTIGHRNIIDIFAFGEFDDGTRYYVMEYLEGQSLKDYLATHSPVAYAPALTLISGVLDALEAAHARNIVHRDLKPDNIFMTTEKEGRFFVKLLDFGIAKFLEGGVQGGRTRTGVPIGTPYYMSPEQASGEKVDALSDIYSMGVILYEMFTGSVPFLSESVMKIINAHMWQEPAPPHELADVDRELEKIILWCLAKEKQKRPATVDALRRALMPVLRRLVDSDRKAPTQLQESAPLIPITTDSIRKAARRKTRPRWPVFVIPVLGAVIVGGGVGLYVALRDPANRDSSVARKEGGGAISAGMARTTRATRAGAAAGAGAATRKIEQGRKVIIQFKVHPRNTEFRLWLDGKQVEKTVVRLTRSTEEKVRFRVEAEGYKSYKDTFLPLNDDTVHVFLEKQKTNEIGTDTRDGTRKPRRRGRRDHRRRDRPGRDQPGRGRPGATRKARTGENTSHGRTGRDTSPTREPRKTREVPKFETF
jgi:serine/threonine protein kinase